MKVFAFFFFSLCFFSPEVIIGLLRSNQRCEVKKQTCSSWEVFQICVLKLILLLHKKIVRKMGISFYYNRCRQRSLTFYLQFDYLGLDQFFWYSHDTKIYSIQIKTKHQLDTTDFSHHTSWYWIPNSTVILAQVTQKSEKVLSVSCSVMSDSLVTPWGFSWQEYWSG